MKSISVFCGSSDGYNETYRETAYDLGILFAARKINLVYGGSKLGLMGAVAEGAFNNGGEVTGVIPNFLKDKEAVNESLTQLITVDTMHERKLKMYELCDGVITLPGGWGTMDELFEMLTWGQLGLHCKPIGLLNINGYYDPLIAQFDMMVQEGFVNENLLQRLLINESAIDLLNQMEEYSLPSVKKWITKQTT